MSRWPFRPTLPPGGARADEDTGIEEELELYLELRTEELVRQGLDPAAARREAEARFGNAADIRRRVRREAGRGRGGMGAGSVGQDVRYALRAFLRNPGFAAVAVATLGLALAGNTAIFSVLDAAVLRALPFPRSDELVFVNGVHRPEGAEEAVRMASIPEFMDWRARSRSLQPMAAVDANSLTLSGDGSAERVDGEMVSEGYFRLVGGEALLGRTFTPEEYTTPDGYPVVVVSHGLWERRFGADPGVLGRTLVVNDRTATVVGVMPADFVGVNADIDVWFPLGMVTFVAPVGALDDRGSRYLPVIARLAPGADAALAQEEMDRIAAELEAEYPNLNEDRGARVQMFRDGYLGTTGRLLWILFGAGALLLVIASANVANLLLVRANARTRELVVRRALGAEGGRIVQQLLTESLLLAILGGVVGVALAAVALEALPGMLPDGVLPAFVEPRLSPRVFGFTFLVLTVVGVVAGLAPALTSARRDLAGALRTGGRAMASGGRARAQQLFVVTQVGLALLLLVGAGLLVRSFRAQLGVDAGVDVDGVQLFRLQAPRDRYPDAASLRLFSDEVLRALADVPGVEAVAAGSDMPFRGSSSGSYIARQDDVENRIRYHRHAVTPGYFELLGTDLVAGRLLEASDAADAPGVAVVTEAMVQRVFPDDPMPVGRSIWVGNPADPANLAEIVGVVENLRFRNLTQSMMDGPNSPDVFFSLTQIPARTLEVAYRATGEASDLGPAVRRAIQAVDPSVPPYFPQSLEEAYRAQTATPRFAAFLMTVLSALAMTLAAVGLYGVLAFTVGQRGQEIALRRALGARAGEVARSVVVDGVRLAAFGLVVGGAAAWIGGSVLDTFLFGVPPRDAATFGGVAAAMLAVSLLAAAVPAWRATRKAPAEALGSD